MILEIFLYILSIVGIMSIVVLLFELNKTIDFQNTKKVDIYVSNFTDEEYEEILMSIQNTKLITSNVNIHKKV